MTEIEKLENTGVLCILTTLYKLNGKTYHQDLRNKANVAINTLDKRLLELKSLNLINDKIEEKFGGKRLIWITPQGRVIAQKLVEIEKILKKI